MKIVKGFRDILPYENSNSETSYSWTSILNNLRDIMELYNFQEIITPVLEYDSTFKTGMGEDTDIVSKEMYEFILNRESTEKNKNEVLKYCLRPEGTAPVVRSVIENSLNKIKSLNKLYYLGPMFRYERSQKGRYRMFHQIGAELIGSDEILYEVELLNLAKDLIQNLKINDTTFELNTIGNRKSMENISEAVSAFCKKNKDTIEEKDYEILNKNPLRFLDKAIHKYNFDNVPKTIDYLDQKSIQRFTKLIKILDNLKFKYSINHQLVRGIDYYNDLVFEVTSKNLGSQNALLAGGRYDTLIEKFGGNESKSIGFAAGIERLILAMDNKNKPKKIINFFIAYNNPELINQSLDIALKLRRLGLKVEIDLDNRSFAKQMKLADKSSALKTIILTIDGINNSLITVKDMKTGKEKSINIKNNFDFLIK